MGYLQIARQAAKRESKITARHFLLALMILVAPACATAQETFEGDLVFGSATLVVPQKYCLLDPEHPVDGVVLDWYPRELYGRMVAFFATCKELERIRQIGLTGVVITLSKTGSRNFRPRLLGYDIFFTDYGYYFIRAGGHYSFDSYGNKSREEVARLVAKRNEELARYVWPGYNSTADNSFAERSSSGCFTAGNPFVDSPSFEPAGYDAIAAYTNTIAPILLANEAQTLAGASATTLLSYYAVTLMLCRFVDDAADIDRLRQDVRAVIRDVVAVNPGE